MEFEVSTVCYYQCDFPGGHFINWLQPIGSIIALIFLITVAIKTQSLATFGWCLLAWLAVVVAGAFTIGTEWLHVTVGLVIAGLGLMVLILRYRKSRSPWIALTVVGLTIYMLGVLIPRFLCGLKCS